MMGPYVMAGLTNATSLRLSPADLPHAVSELDEAAVLLRSGRAWLQAEPQLVDPVRLASAPSLPLGAAGLDQFLFRASRLQGCASGSL